MGGEESMVGGLICEKEKRRVGVVEIRRESCFCRTLAYLAVSLFF